MKVSFTALNKGLTQTLNRLLASVLLIAIWLSIGTGVSSQIRSERGRSEIEVADVFSIGSDSTRKGGDVEKPLNLNPQTVPFLQNWSNTNLIIANDDWAAVPGIIGYRGDALTELQGVDPQTILADGSATPQNVSANRNDPNTQATSGGLAEFDGIANPTIALNGSGTSDAPNLVISLNTTGTTAINVAYNLRDIDGSSDNAIQPVALQYRVGDSGDYTNLPLGFVADASSGPNLATLVTPISVALPVACENQSLVQIRVMTTNAVGQDEWIGVDDINITGTGGGGGAFSAFMSASPASVVPTGTTLLTVAVTPATTPPSTDIQVVGNLTQIGGSALQNFVDDGTGGDVTPGDNVFSFLASIPGGTSSGIYNVTAVASDAQSRFVNLNQNITVNGPPETENPLLFGNPSNATANVANENNYLMTKPQYSLSYNRSKAGPNWVAWRLDSSWIGGANRQDDYRGDTTLPAGWYQVQSSDYSEPVYDRGHMCPSGDRTRSIPDNSATFLMTNFLPQHPDNNQGPWEEFETYCRTLAGQGKEIYIYTGPAGQDMNAGGGMGFIGNGVVVPASTWKVVLVIDNGTNDLQRVGKKTRMFGIIVSNIPPINRNAPGRNFRVTVDQVETLTGYDFFSNLNPRLQARMESSPDTQ
ncbi:MAG: DNA/RNA non-specific endonuclease [Pyrinomonadaceae bacterium]